MPGTEPPLVGRSAEEAAIRRFATPGGGPRALVVTGEPGIGSSSLWARGVDAAMRHGSAVLACRLAEQDQAMPYNALADLLVGVTVDGLPPLQRAALDAALLRGGGAVPDPRALFTAVLGLLRAVAAGGPVLVAVDGAQWLDRESAEVLRHVVRRVTAEDVALLLTSRSRTHPLAAELRDVAELPLRGLALPELDAAVRARTGLRLSHRRLRQLAHLTRGNPTTASELARAMAAGPAAVTATLRRLADRQLRGLSPAARDALLYAAALSEPALPLVRSALATCPDQLSGLTEAEEHGVVTVVAGRIRFSDPLVRAGLYRGVSAERRRLAHRRLAAVVAEPGERARHLALAGHGPDAALAAELERTAAAAAPRAAPALWCLATAMTPSDLEAARASRATAAARTLFAAGSPIVARRMLTQVATTAPAPERQRAVLLLAEIADGDAGAHAAPAEDFAVSADPVAARERSESEYRAAVRAGDEPATARALVRLAEAGWWLGDWGPAAAQAAHAAELARQCGQRRWLGRALWVSGLVAANRGQETAARALASRGLEVARAIDDQRTEQLHRFALAALELACGDPRAADLQLGRCTGLDGAPGLLLAADQVEVAAGCGDLTRAEHLLTAARERLPQTPLTSVTLARVDGIVRLAVGDLDGARAATERALAEHARLRIPFCHARTLLLLGRVHRAAKRRGAAREHLEAARERFDTLDAAVWSRQAAAELSRCGYRRSAGADLTPTEERVAALVASGLTNREAGAVAYLSPKTVEVNLSRIYRKLGVRNRHELARCEQFRQPLS